MEKEREATESALIAVLTRLENKEEKYRTEIENRLLQKINLMFDLDNDDDPLESHYEGDF